MLLSDFPCIAVPSGPSHVRGADQNRAPITEILFIWQRQELWIGFVSATCIEFVEIIEVPISE